MREDKKPSSYIRRSAMEAKRDGRFKRLIPAVGGVMASVLLVVYVTALLVTKNGNFTISIKDYGDRSLSLSLCETDSFQHPTSTLKATEVVNMNNITYTMLPDDINDINGAHNGDNYLAYTFYVKNTGERSCSYQYRMLITRATVGIDAAVRVRIYYEPQHYVAESGTASHGGGYTDYAKAKTGGNGAPEVDPGNRVMTNFYSNDLVAQAQQDNFAPGDIAKFTVVIWLEGEDPDCTDDVLGGQFKVDMNLEIVGD